MTSLLDKSIVFLLCVSLYLTNTQDSYSVVIVLVAVIFVSLQSFFDREWNQFILFCIAVALCLFFPNSTFFLPLIAYDVCSTKWQWFIPLSLIPISQFLFRSQFLSFVLLFIFMLLSCFLRKRTELSQKKQLQYNLLRDELTEKQLQLVKANRELLEKQDYEVHLATLKERNRIAGELHDSIGHVLTRSLLQTGALLATCPDEPTKQSLAVLQNSLSEGMDEVRASIHDLHDDSVDLYDEVRAYVSGFHFCPVTLRYTIETAPEKKMQYAFLSILKESLANIVRHSNATAVTVILFEHPALYQLTIKDNGSSPKKKVSASGEFIENESEGMGLSGIRRRVESLGGNVIFRNGNGFEVFVSVPKEIK